jgi:hypothetical protein
MEKLRKPQKLAFTAEVGSGVDVDNPGELPRYESIDELQRRALSIAAKANREILNSRRELFQHPNGIQSHIKQDVREIERTIGASRINFLIYFRTILGRYLDKVETVDRSERASHSIEFSTSAGRLLANCLNDKKEYNLACDKLTNIIQTVQSWTRTADDGGKLSGSDPMWFRSLVSRKLPKYRGSKSDGDPIIFLKKNYISWLSDGRLTQSYLRRIDEKLLNALKYEARKRNITLAELVPSGIKSNSQNSLS